LSQYIEIALEAYVEAVSKKQEDKRPKARN